MYYLELHKLVVEDATLQLTERNPIKPMAKNEMFHMGKMSHYQTFTPLEPGIYRYVYKISPLNTGNHVEITFLFTPPHPQKKRKTYLHSVNLKSLFCLFHIFSSPCTKCRWAFRMAHQMASVVRRPSTFYSNDIFYNTTRPILMKLGRNTHCMKLYQDCSKNAIPC
jgi:hypothetical protein